jgi:deoxycytidine triphosphate deaminase
MSIKSDKWIRRMAEQHGMIEPFEPGQIREREGRKIISYGTSSYGYDNPQHGGRSEELRREELCRFS